MTVKELTKTRVITRKQVLFSKSDCLAIWQAARGMWKKKKVNPVAYQKRLRKQADHVV